MSKENFKLFARLHPELVSSVINQKTNWQQLYELYEIYGEDSPIWNTYFQTNNNSSLTFPDTFKDFFATLKNMDRIIYLEEGKVAESGTFDELARKKNGKIAKLWKMQQLEKRD